MKIGIIGAMDEEITLLCHNIQNTNTKQYAGCEIYSGQLNGMDVSLLKSGIGKVAAAASTTLLLEHYRADLVINIGSAGGINRSLSVGDIAISDQVCYHDADLTAFGYQAGQMANCPVTFIADQPLIQLAQRCICEFNMHATTGLICSGDHFINGGDSLARIREIFPTAVAVDMEAAAIAHVCHLFSVPFIVVRAISDVADKQSPLNFDEFLPIAAKQSALIVMAMLGYLASSSSKITSPSSI